MIKCPRLVSRLIKVKHDYRGLMMMGIQGVSRHGCCLRKEWRRLGGILLDWWWLSVVCVQITLFKIY